MHSLFTLKLLISASFLGLLMITSPEPIASAGAQLLSLDAGAGAQLHQTEGRTSMNTVLPIGLTVARPGARRNISGLLRVDLGFAGGFALNQLQIAPLVTTSPMHPGRSVYLLAGAGPSLNLGMGPGIKSEVGIGLRNFLFIYSDINVIFGDEGVLPLFTCGLRIHTDIFKLLF